MNKNFNWKNKISWNNIYFQVYKELSVFTLLNNQYKKNNKIKLKNLIILWKEIIKKNFDNQSYQDFYIFLQKYSIKNKNKFNFQDLIKKWKNKKDIWMCDTETTFTSLVPNNYLFKDEKKAYGKNAKETIKNLHIQQIINKEKLLLYSEKERKNLSKKGIKEWFKENPSQKPYLWAWNCYNFETKEYMLFNYNSTVKFLNSYNKRTLHYYHNLSYDAFYICDSLINTFNYNIIIEPNFEEKKILKEKEKPWKQPKKTIIILANENKILSVKICNNQNKIIILECTYLKILSSVDKIGKILNKPKLEINYMLPRSKDHKFSKKEADYIFTDVDIILSYLNDIAKKYKQRFNTSLKWLLTLGQTSFSMLKKIFGKDKWEKMFEFLLSKKEWNSLSKKDKEIIFNNKRPTLLSAKESEYLRKGVYNKLDNSWSGGFYNGGYTNYNIKYVGIEHTNISSLDIKSSYPDKWQHYKMPYGPMIYNCKCNNLDFKNNSQHFKLYEIEILEDLKILPNKENMLPIKCEANDEKGNLIINIEYYPWQLKGKYPLSQYTAKIFFTLFNPKNDQYILKKTNCFNHKIIKELQKYDDLWQKEKETPNLKIENSPYYELTKLFLNGPTGKFGQKEIIEEKQFYINENNLIDHKMVKTKEFEDLYKFSYLPIIIATTDLSRLHLLSLIETIGWENWHNSDTDSCKFWLPEKFKPENKPKYLNLINNNIETIYNEENENIFGKWDLEWTTTKFKCSGKKKYMYLKNNKKEVICAGAPNSVKEKMEFESFFVGFQTIENEKNKIDKLNGMPTILPTSFQIKNVFKSKNWILMSRKHLLHDYYLKNLIRLDKLIEKSKKETDKYFINYDESEESKLEKEIGVFN